MTTVSRSRDGDGTGLAEVLTSSLCALPDLLAIVNEDCVVEYVAPSVSRLLGLPPEAVVAHSVFEIIAPEDRRNFALWLTYAQSGATVPEMVHRVRRGDGSMACFESRLRRVASNGSADVVLAARDISTRAVAEQRITAGSQLWTDVYEVLREGVFVTDESDKIFSVNPVAARLVGMTPGELVGSVLTDHVLLASASGTPLPEAHPLATVARRDQPAQLFVAARREHDHAPWMRATAVRLAHAGFPGPGGRRTALLIDPQWLVETVRTEALDGTRCAPAPNQLSRREIEVLRLLAGGRDVREAAIELGISIHTARAYVKSVLRKLEVRTQLQAVIHALRAGLLDLS